MAIDIDCPQVTVLRKRRYCTDCITNIAWRGRWRSGANIFRTTGGGLIVTADELMQQNVFWRELRELLKADIVRCLLVVRQEQGWGQGAMSFVKVREFFVPRLQRQFLDKILLDLTSGVVENPERGWDSLREQLEADLYASGGILPIQMRVVVRQLGSLKKLTVAVYDRAGGIIGLSAQYASEVIPE